MSSNTIASIASVVTHIARRINETFQNISTVLLPYSVMILLVWGGRLLKIPQMIPMWPKLETTDQQFFKNLYV